MKHPALRRLLVLFLAFGWPADGVLAQVVGPNFRVSQCGSDNQPAVAAQGNHVLAAWMYCTSSVGAAASRDGGATWIDVSAVPSEGFVRDDTRGICAGDSGRFYLATPVAVFMVGRSIEVYEGRFVGSTFEWRRLANALPYSEEVKPEDALQILFDRRSRNLYMTFSDVHETGAPSDLRELGVPVAVEYRIMFTRSTDGGSSWQPAIELIRPGSNGAKMVLGPEGELSVIWENYLLGKIMGRRTDDFGVTFGPEFEVGAIQDNIGLEPAGWEGNHNRRNPLFPLNGAMGAPAAFAVAVDRSDGPRRGTWYLATAEHALGTVGSVSGTTWEIEPNHFNAQANTFEIGADVRGQVSGSETSSDVDVFTFAGEAGRTIWLSGAFSSSPPATIDYFNLSCGDDTTQIAPVGDLGLRADGSAPVAIYTLPSTGAYWIITGTFGYAINYTLRTRDYLVDPTSVARDHRDILLASSTDGGVTWSPKVRVSDGPVGSDDAFPAVTVDDAGRVHVAWYDRRESAECGSEVHTYWTWSDDGGQTFQPPRRVSEQASSTRPQPSWAVGDHLALATEGERAYVLWTLTEQGVGASVWGSVITDLPTAVLVSGLAAEESATGVELRWWASDVREVREFRVHRATETSQYEVVGVVSPRADGKYHWTDNGAGPGVRYRYRLEVVRYEGTSLWEGPVVYTVPMPAVRLAWHGASPNPFSDTVDLELETPEPGQTRVSVYDVTGHKVVDLRAEPRGDRTLVRWDARDSRGRAVAPGVYLVRAHAGAQTVVRQVVRMK